MIKMRFKFRLDTPRVMSALSKGENRTLFKAGGFLRKTARSLIRRRKKISAPGQPPSTQTGYLKEAIRFDVEKNRRTVVIGPVPLNRSNDQHQLPATTLEFGGRVASRITTSRHGKKKTKKRVVMRYQARPFMGPALETTIGVFPKMAKGSVVGP